MLENADIQGESEDSRCRDPEAPAFVCGENFQAALFIELEGLIPNRDKNAESKHFSLYS
jgi:hypothetical protein